MAIEIIDDDEKKGPDGANEKEGTPLEDIEFTPAKDGDKLDITDKTPIQLTDDPNDDGNTITIPGAPGDEDDTGGEENPSVSPDIEWLMHQFSEMQGKISAFEEQNKQNEKISELTSNKTKLESELGELREKRRTVQRARNDARIYDKSGNLTEAGEQIMEGIDDEIADKRSEIRGITKDIENAKKPPEVSKVPEAAAGWVEENRYWLQTDEFKHWKEIAEDVENQLIQAGWKASDPKTYQHLDRIMAENGFEKPQSRYNIPSPLKSGTISTTIPDRFGNTPSGGSNLQSSRKSIPTVRTGTGGKSAAPGKLGANYEAMLAQFSGLSEEQKNSIRKLAKSGRGGK